MPAIKTISIIIPAKDEEKRLPHFLRTVIDFCKGSTFHYEIIVVDDGSSDQTAAQVLTFKKDFAGLSLISLERNHGKGYAVKQGFLLAKGDIILFLDADGSTGPQEIERQLHYFNEGVDVVIGSRVLKDADSRVESLAYRQWMGSIFNFLVSSFLIKGIKDTQCGFKMFRASVIPILFNPLKLEGFGFDLEILYLAQQNKLRVKEVAVNWTHVQGSKVNIIKDSWRMIINIYQIRQWHQKI